MAEKSCSNQGCTKESCEGCPSNAKNKAGGGIAKEPMNAASNVKKVIGVVSGKGGVGKSFVTASLAAAMNRAGYKVGIMDADITGPSIPKMFGIHGQVYGTDDGMVPMETENGIKIMSINLLLDDEEAPVIWRGPVIAGVVKQFWNETVWGDVDYLFVDMPPGTGDGGDGAGKGPAPRQAVPEENYQSFLDAVAQAGNVTYKSQQADDVTTQYMDVETRLANLEAQRTRLQELQAQADNLSDLLQIETSLTDVQSQIESWQSQLDWYSNQVQQCTVYVNLNEVQNYTPTDESFLGSVGAAFAQGWSNFVNGLQQLAVWLAGAWPVVLVVVAAAAGFAVWRKKRKK